MGLMDIVPPGVVTGDNLMKLMEYCRDNAVCILTYFSCIFPEVAFELLSINDFSRFFQKRLFLKPFILANHIWFFLVFTFIKLSLF